MIMLIISFDGLAYTLPVNPEELSIKQKASNTNIDIIGLGKATRKGEPELRTITIKSFFPNPKSRYYFNATASTYIEFLEKIWHTENKDNKVASLISYGLKDDIKSKEINMPFVIEQFNYTYKGGDFDTEYELSIKEYKPYGISVVEDFSQGMQSGRLPSTVKENIPGIMQDTQPTTDAKTYTINSGDTLWTIAKRSTGDGSNWKALYELNKDVIGTNPDRIMSGTILTLPENWNSPVAKTNISTSLKVKSGSDNTTKQTPSNSTASSTPGSLKETTEIQGYAVPDRLVGTLSQRQVDLANIALNFANTFKSHKKYLDEMYSKVAKPNASLMGEWKYQQEYRTLEKRYKEITSGDLTNPNYLHQKIKLIQDLQRTEQELFARYSRIDK